MYKCKICGNEFELKIEEHYVSRDPGEERLGFASLNAVVKENKLYDAFDCPYCGCQNIMQERKPLWTADEETPCIELAKEPVENDGSNGEFLSLDEEGIAI